MTLCRANENTGGLVVIPQSHKQHSAMCQRLATPEQGDFVTIAGGDPILAGVTARLVCAEPGGDSSFLQDYFSCNYLHVSLSLIH